MNKKFEMQEILQEMDELVIYGGFDISDPQGWDIRVVNCGVTNNYCGEANCSCTFNVTTCKPDRKVSDECRVSAR